MYVKEAAPDDDWVSCLWAKGRDKRQLSPNLLACWVENSMFQLGEETFSWGKE